MSQYPHSTWNSDVMRNVCFSVDLYSPPLFASGAVGEMYNSNS